MSAAHDQYSASSVHDVCEKLFDEQMERIRSRATELFVSCRPYVAAMILADDTPWAARQRAFRLLNKIQQLDELKELLGTIPHAESLDFTGPNGTVPIDRAQIRQIFAGADTWSLNKWCHVLAEFCVSESNSGSIK